MKTSLVLDCLDSQKAIDRKNEGNEVFGRGVKLSQIRAKLEDTSDITSLLGAFQRLGFLKIVYNPSVDEEPRIQITNKGKKQIIELLLTLQQAA